MQRELGQVSLDPYQQTTARIRFERYRRKNAQASRSAAAAGKSSSTRSARAKSRPRVRADGMTQQARPAALAAASPRSESSITRQRAGDNPKRSTARRYGSGWGLLRW